MPDQQNGHKPIKRSVYRQWVEREGIPLVQGHYIPDLKTVAVQPWQRRGAQGVFINHDASDTSNDCYVLEMQPGGEVKAQRQLYEEMIYVLKGRGATTVWDNDGRKSSFEWREGSLFAIPLNAWHQHFNGSGSEPARFLAVTSAPSVINTFADADFVFNCDYQFRNRYSGEAEYFNGEGKLTGMVWETNFVADVPGFELLDYPERGAGGRNIKFTLARNQMGAHVSEFPIGTYKKGHRHGPGAHVVVLNGQGYSLMWPEGEPIQRFDWQPGTLIIPPDRSFHQHFNTGATPARYLALRFSGNNEFLEKVRNVKSSLSTRLGGDQIDYEDEDEQVRTMYAEACAKNGVSVKMDQFQKRREPAAAT